MHYRRNKYAQRTYNKFNILQNKLVKYYYSYDVVISKWSIFLYEGMTFLQWLM